MMNSQSPNSLPDQNSSMLAVIKQDLFNSAQTLPTNILENDPVNFDLASNQSKALPPEFKEIAPKLHQNYLYWQYLRDNFQPTQQTFYRYLKAGIEKKQQKKGKASQTPEGKQVFLLLETRLTLMTLTALILASEDYLKEDHLQDAKESTDTALSTLYEFLKMREKLESSLEKAIESIKVDILNEAETYQYISYLLDKLDYLKSSNLIQSSKLYVVRKQLEKLKETLLLLFPDRENATINRTVNQQKIGRLMNQLLRVMVAEEKYIINIQHDNLVNRLSFSPDSTYLVISSVDGRVKMIDLLTLKDIDLVKHNSPVNSLSFSPDGIYLATASDDNTAKLINLDNFKEVKIIQHKNKVNLVVFSPNGTYLATASDDGTVKLIAIANLEQVKIIYHLSRANSLSFSPDGIYLATASNDMTVKLLETANFREVMRIEHGDKINSVSFSPDGIYLATASDDTTSKLINISSFAEIATIQHPYQVYSVKFAKNGAYLATTSKEKNAKLINLSILRQQVLLHQEIWVQSVSISPNGTYSAAILYDNRVTLIEVKTDREIASFPDNDYIDSVTFSPQETYVAIVSTDKMKIIEIATMKEITTIKQKGTPEIFCFSPDEHYLVTVLEKTKIQLVNLSKLLELAEKETEEKEEIFDSSTHSQTTGIVHLQKAQAFFFSWLRTESNHSSFYEYMLAQAEQSKEGLSVKYCLPILETHLLLQSLGFLFVNAEKHYQTVYPTLSEIHDKEIRGIAMQDMKQSISAALSTLYEFIAQRLEFDQEDYQQGIERLRNEIEQNIDNTAIFFQIYHDFQVLLQLEGIKYSSELQTVKEMLKAINDILQPLLPKDMRNKKSDHSSILIKKDLSKEVIINAIYDAKETEIMPLFTEIQSLGLLNDTVAFVLITKISPKQVIELCQRFPQKVINKEVALAAIKKRRKTHYIGTLLFWTNISNKEILLNILQSAPLKRWWLR